MPRTCPDCNVLMSQRSFFGVLLDTCEHCAGIFFDEGEISRIREQAGDRALDELDNMIQPEPGHVDPTTHATRHCPACASEMRRFRYLYSSPVFLDTCDACGGVWVENGELQQMSEYIQSAKQGRPTTTHELSGDVQAKVEALTALDRARGLRARIAASTIAYHRD